MGCVHGRDENDSIKASKWENLMLCCDHDKYSPYVPEAAGIVVATALDHRNSLRSKLEKAGDRKFSSGEVEAFKSSLTKHLYKASSAILLDLKYGNPARREIVAKGGCGLIVAYEAGSCKEKAPDLAEGFSVRKLKEQGANGIKLIIYWHPETDESEKEALSAFVERVGSECHAEGLPFFLEVKVRNLEACERKRAIRQPQLVLAIVEEFSKDRYRADVLKLEFPVIPKFVKGLKNTGSPPPSGYTHDLKEAQE
ncbi:hypothetical protein AAMO2058_000299500 [Amorphochlora amoebiformis]|uniref:Tagatose-bisphosphate aldolase n=1 Tax=Amorphochlora amoebiformis TaxID=1561963 RepID=A0A7S0DHC2_9EUKA|mmetsp:Transcript_27430/g.43550  ORF Transcript_27430/g.43550 Transcript_27430/m.43550 type:complete len:254 (+) Transcript_27430:64-825(+)